MMKLVKRVSTGVPSLRIELTLEKRVRARFKTHLLDGSEIGVFLDRGPIMRNGDLLESEDGVVVQVVSAPEQVSVVESEDTHLLMRAAYHLGNRHVPLQVLQNELRYQHDHVLDQMLINLGISPSFAELPFEPEAGAYGEHGSDHAHGHTHGAPGKHAH
ncbi:MAG: urease accessory protein UreE [Pseudomonadota bacterium]|nr:urease accessory protein UreE [Pseudomonadota bacterium]